MEERRKPGAVPPPAVGPRPRRNVCDRTRPVRRRRRRQTRRVGFSASAASSRATSTSREPARLRAITSWPWTDPPPQPAAGRHGRAASLHRTSAGAAAKAHRAVRRCAAAPARRRAEPVGGDIRRFRLSAPRRRITHPPCRAATAPARVLFERSSQRPATDASAAMIALDDVDAVLGIDRRWLTPVLAGADVAEGFRRRRTSALCGPLGRRRGDDALQRGGHVAERPRGPR